MQTDEEIAYLALCALQYDKGNHALVNSLGLMQRLTPAPRECACCFTRHSPTWRKSILSDDTRSAVMLCNACGLQQRRNPESFTKKLERHHQQLTPEQPPMTLNTAPNPASFWNKADTTTAGPCPDVIDLT